MIVRALLPRFLAAISIIAVHISVQRTTYLELYFAVAMGHFALAFLYSYKNLSRILSSPRSYLPMAVVIALAVGSASTGSPPMILAFAIHVAFSDVYTEVRVRDTVWHQLKMLRISRLVLAFATYAALLHLHPDVINHPRHSISIILAVAALTFGVALFRARALLGPRAVMELTLFELIGVGGAIVLHGVAIRLDHIVAYHFLFWFYAPLYDCVVDRKGSLANYLGLTVILTGAVYALTSAADFQSDEVITLWVKRTDYVAYLHFVTSLALSRANPRFLTRLFYPVDDRQPSGAR